MRFGCEGHIVQLKPNNDINLKRHYPIQVLLTQILTFSSKKREDILVFSFKKFWPAVYLRNFSRSFTILNKNPGQPSLLPQSTWSSSSNAILLLAQIPIKIQREETLIKRDSLTRFGCHFLFRCIDMKFVIEPVRVYFLFRFHI
jgi:hypothetical protein